MLRSVLSVIAGYLAWSAVWIGGGAAMSGLFPDQPNERGGFDSPALLLALLALSVVCSAIGGLVCAKIARARSLAPPALLAGLLVLTGLGVQISAWDTMPAWYHITFLLLLAPVTIASAKAVRPQATE